MMREPQGVEMHGAHNTFTIVDERVTPVLDRVAFARRLQTDGLLLVEESTIADARMRVINADGSEAEMCGNGLRCVARYLAENGEGDERAIETLAGVVRTRVVAREPEFLVRSAIGRPRIGGEGVLHIDDVSYAYTAVDVGNPHAVIFVDEPDAIDIERIGPQIERAAPFAHGANVHFAYVEDRTRVRVRHWERGAGATQACGTGTAAVAAVALARDLVENPVIIDVPGGRLHVELFEGEAIVTGPAERIGEEYEAVS